MKAKAIHLQAIAILIFCLGMLVGNTYAQDEQNPAAFAAAGGPIDSSMDAFGATGAFTDSSLAFGATGAPTDSSMTFEAAGAFTDSSVAAFGAAGVPTDSVAAFAASGVPTDSMAAFYTSVAPPSVQQNVPLAYDVVTSPPTAVYYGGSYVPWASISFGSLRTPQFWVLTRGGWGVYATCPFGGWAKYMMYVPYTGALKLYELYPDGTVKFYNYGWSTRGFKYLWFIADTPGRHISFITVTDRPSNYVTIDVR